MKLDFVPFAGHPPGSLARLLRSSYAPLLEELPDTKVDELLRAWYEYDAAVYAEPGTVGACGFYSSLREEVVGFGSWNPTGWPHVGRIGHNCVLPRHQRRGYGRLQILEILRRFQDAGFRSAAVRTDEHPFFEPARRMYTACGFRECRRHEGLLMRPYSMIEYERRLREAAARI